MVTLSGFPPNAAIFFLIQRNAAAWSFNPMFPGTTSSSVLRNPEENPEEEINMIVTHKMNGFV
jgi:hypothetical protein